MTIENINFSGKRVLLRVDFNVPLDADYRITDDTRMRAALPTIQHILQAGASQVLICSHLGRPLKKLDVQGQIQREKFSLKHLVGHLAELLGRPVLFAEDCMGAAVEAVQAQAPQGGVILLENTRFHAGEEKGAADLAQQMAALADIYINDAFGTAHRAHASTSIVAQHFGPEQKAFGFLMRQEVEQGRKLLRNPEKPFVAVVGGAKVSDKILLLERLLDLADHILIGGGMAYTFFKAQGGEVGNSLLEADKLDLALELLAKAKAKGVEIHLPVDSLSAERFAADAPALVEPSGAISPQRMGLDIGPQACHAFAQVLSQAKTILWNGPMGVFEFEAYAQGTKTIGAAIAQATQENGAFSLVGGGDSVAAIHQIGQADKVSFISTGGGAMLEFLEGRTLPGIAALEA